MDKKRVGVLRGGQGENYENSLARGGKLIFYVFENLSDKYKPIDIFVDREGIWHIAGVPAMPAELVNKVDIIWNTSDASLSKILQDLGIPNIGIGFFTSLLKNRKNLEKHVKELEIKMPRHLVLPIYQKDFDGPIERYAIKKAKEVHEKFSSPWIVKSLNQNFDMGVHVAETFPELVNAIEDGVEHGVSILVEELITGKNVFVHSVSGFRGDDIYTFPVAGFSKNEKEELNNLAKNLHKHIGAEHYLKLNFVLHPKKGIYLTSLEFFLDLDKDSHFCKSCESVGAKHHQVIDHLIESVL